MKKTISLVLIAVLLTTVLCACGKTDPASPGEEPGAELKQLSVRMGPDPETLDPALVTIDCDGVMIAHPFEGLLSFNEDAEPIPGCAEKWETSEDGLIWTFHLREGLKWSDGSPLTANDFVYSWKRAVTDSPNSESFFFPIKGYEEAAAGDTDAFGVSAPDDRTFAVELSVPCTFFANIVINPTLYPVQRAAIETAGDNWALSPETYIGNGAFSIAEWVPGSHIIMKKNPLFWNADAVKLDKIKWVLTDDLIASYNSFLSGELQFVKEPPAEATEELRNSEDFHIEPTIGTLILCLNDNVELLKDPLIRKALSLSVDRQYLADTVLQGLFFPALSFIGSGWSDPGGGDFSANANGGKPYISDDYEANLAEATKLMRDAGYAADPENPDMHISYSTTDAGKNMRIAEYLRAAWAKIGVEVTIKVIDSSNALQMRRSGDYEITRNGLGGDYNDPSSLLDVMCSTSGSHDCCINDAEFDAAMETARRSADTAVRSEALHKAEDILMEKTISIPLAFYTDYWLQSAKLQGMLHTPTSYYIFTYADIAE